MADAKVRFHDPSIRRAAPVAPPRGAFRMIPAALGALRRWWAGGRHYRPERRYHARRAIARPASAGAALTATAAAPFLWRALRGAPRFGPASTGFRPHPGGKLRC